MKLANKVSIVTGVAQGIGKAVCLEFAKEDSDVLIAEIMRELAEEVSKEIWGMGSRKSVSFGLDVANEKQVNEMVKTAVDKFRKIDILENVAGIYKAGAIQAMLDRAPMGRFGTPEEVAEVVLSIGEVRT